MNGNPESNYPEAGTTGAYDAPSQQGATSSADSYAAGQSSASAYTTASGYSGPVADAYTAPGYVPPPPPGYAPPYGYPAAPPPVPGAPNPGLAILLGFIPGVGAMYNGQFAKGIAQIVIFSVLTSLSSHAHDPLDVIFGLLTAGWYFYMVFDSYQTARARREGLVPPDPFGLNNIGERFGMPTNPNWNDFVARPATAATPDAARTSNPYAGPPVDPAAATAYTYTPPVGNPYAPPVTVPPYQPGAMPPTWYPAYAETPAQPYGADPAAASSPAYQAAYTPVDPAAMPPFPPQPASRIPTGAIWLIGLGVLALIGSLAHNFYWRGHIFGAAACFIFGAVLLVQQTSLTRKLYRPGSAAYQWSLLHQSRFGLILLVVGVLQTVAATHVASWHSLWPYLLIFFGLLQVADRSLYNRTLADPPVFANGYTPSGSFTSAGPAPASKPVETATSSEEVR